MIPKKTDRRIFRTKRMIMEAFILLMEEKGFEAITVITSYSIHYTKLYEGGFFRVAT